MESTTIKRHNRELILRELFAAPSMTKRQIADATRLSMPTITENLRELAADGLIVPAEARASTGGRKAQTWQFNARHRTAIGVALRPTEVVCMAVDLRGNVIAEHKVTMARRNDNAYYERAAHTISTFAQSLPSPIGVCFALPSSAARHCICVAEDWNAATESYQGISRILTLPCSRIARNVAYATVELHNHPLLRNAVCLYLGEYINSAIVMDGVAREGNLEHMQLDASGDICRCGSRGCLEVLCSSRQLTEEGESLPGFFGVLEQGERNHHVRMDRWLGSLAHAVNNIRTFVPADVILCGPIADYLDDSEIAQLERLTTCAEHVNPSARNPQVMRGCCVEYQDAVGAAQSLIPASHDGIPSD